MGERIRKAAIRVLLITGTTVAIVGYNLTRSPFFVPLPFLVGVVLAILVVRAPECTPEEVAERKRVRRNGFIQLVISCVILTVMVVVASVRHWGVADVTGFLMMEGTLGLLAILALGAYRRSHRRVRQPEDSTCDVASDDHGV